MRKYTDKELFEFAYRANTPEKIAIADRWVRAHRGIISLEMHDRLIRLLEETNKRIFLEKMRVYENKIIKYGHLIDTSTGEATPC